MTRSRLTAALIVCLLGLSVASSAPAFTRSDISVAPDASQLVAEAGKPLPETLTIVNLSGLDYHVTSSITDLDADRSGEFSSRPAGSLEHSAATWGTIEPSELNVAAGHTATVKVTWTPPAGTPAGGYAAGVGFKGTAEGRVDALGFHAALIDVRGGVAARNEARLLHVSMPKTSFGSTVPVKLTFENSGATHVVAEGNLIVRDQLSRITARVAIPKSFVLPGHVRDLTVEVPVPFVPGAIRVGAYASFGPRIANGASSAKAYAFTWWSVGVLGAILLLLLRVVFGITRRIVRRRRRRHEAPMFTGSPAPPTRTAWTDAEVEPAPLYRPRGPVVRGLPAREATSEEDALFVVAAPDPVDEPAVPSVYQELEALRPVPVPDDDHAPLRPASRADEAESWGAEPEPVEPAVPAAPRPLAIWRPTPVRDEPRAEPVIEPELPSPADGLLSALLEQVHAGLWQSPDATISSAASVRRAGVAIGLLAEGAGQSGARVEVGLDVLRSIEVDPEVIRLVEEAYTRALRHNDADALAPLALGLDVVGSRVAPEALLRAYGSASGVMAGQLLDALKACDPDDLRVHRNLFLALPKERRQALRSA